MSSSPAAWQTAVKVKPLEIGPSPYTSPGDNEIVIKNGAVAINPVDWAIQEMGEALFNWIKYPTILGTDVAGEVVEVGGAVTRFKIGDRVVGLALGSLTNNPSASAFQTYTVLLDHMASPIPSTLSYESAAVIPLGLSTAACGLFQKDYLALQHPTVPPKPTGKALLVWAGATSVGSNAIQLGVAAGYEVITTSSPANFDYVRKLGASQVFDYKSTTVVADLLEAFKGKDLAGAIAIGHLSPDGNAAVAEACLEIVAKSEGNNFVAMAMHFDAEKVPSGIGAKFIFGSDLKDNEVGPAIFVDFLPKALTEGTFIAAPDALIVGKGLESIQAGFDRQRQGVSAQKVVISL